MTQKTENGDLKRAFVAALTVLLLCAGGYAGRADARIWSVTNAGDDPSNPVAGTLRYAIENASGGDLVEINFHDREIVLTSEISIQKNITVRGFGPSCPTVIRQKGPRERVFRIGQFSCVIFNALAISGGCATPTGTNPGGGGILNYGDILLFSCTISKNNSSNYGGGIDNYGKVTLRDTLVEYNTASHGGGIYTRDGGSCELHASTVINNKNDQLLGPYSADGDSTIGNAPNRSATALSGYEGETEPEPRSIVGDDDVEHVKNALSDAGSALHGAIAEALSEDLGRTPAGTGARLYYANTFENVVIESQDLVVEYTASWPESVRYYSLFCRADGSGYEIPDRGVQFEIKAGQSLPDGVTPPNFYEEGEGLMTWRNVVTDNGSYDLNPGVGVVTFRVCSVRAAEAAGDTGSGGGCDAAAGTGFAPLALLLGIPLTMLRTRR